MQNKSRFSLLVATCVAGAISLGLVGCGSNEASSQSAQSSESQVSAQADTQSATESATSASGASSTSSSTSAAESTVVLGTKSDSSVEVALTNGLSKGITSFSMSAAGADEYGENLLNAGETIKAKGNATLNVTPVEESNFDIRVQLEGSDEYVEFYDVPLATLKSATLKSSNGANFVDYVDVNGTKGSTNEEASAAEEATTGESENEGESTSANATNNNANYQADEGAEAQEAAPVETNDYTPEESYEAEPAYEPAAEPVVEAEPVQEEAPVVEEAAPEQSSDACQGDVVLR